MALLGPAALAMWWDMSPEMAEEFQDWHSHEHFPERLGVPGFRRASRWMNQAGQVFVLYELASHGVLSSPDYLARLNAPSDWSRRLMPYHRQMIRAQTHVLTSFGGGIASAAHTVRFTVTRGHEQDVQAQLADRMIGCTLRRGIVGAHVLRHETPAIAATTEQQLRGGADRPGDWVLVLSGYDEQALAALSADLLPAATNPSIPPEARQTFRLMHAAVAADVDRLD